METMEKEQTTVERPEFKKQYEHFIGGEWVKPSGGEYFDNISPIDGKPFTKAARGNKKDMDLALDAAHAAFKTVNCYHAYPAHAPFGGYKKSGLVVKTIK